MIETLMIGGLALGAAGTVFGGITGAGNAKAQALAAQMSDRWSNFQQQWQNMQSNFELSQKQRFEKEQREAVRSTSLANMLSEQREILRQSALTQSVFSSQYMQAVGSANSAMETRNVSTTDGTGKLIRNQLDQMVLRDAAALRRNRSIELQNSKARRDGTLSGLGPRVIQLPSTYLNSTPQGIPNTTGMLIGSVLSAIGNFSMGAGAAHSMYGGS